MEQNKITFERHADRLQQAMKEEKLMNKEVAEIFDVPASYMSTINKHPEKTPLQFMEKIRTWNLSGRPLRGYKLPEPSNPEPVEKTKEQADSEIYAGIRKRRSKLAVKQLVKEHQAEMAAAVAETINTEGPSKEDIAADLRQQYEQAQGTATEQPDPEPAPKGKTVTVTCKEGKVDMSKLDIRTGVIAAIEIQIMEDGSFSLEYRPRR